MKTSIVKNAILKEVAIILICLLLGLAGTAYAGGEEAEKKKAMRKAEIELLQELNKDFEENIAAIQAELRDTSRDIERIEVYNMKGELLKEVDLTGKDFYQQRLVPRADLLTIDGKVAVYIVL